MLIYLQQCRNDSNKWEMDSILSPPINLMYLLIWREVVDILATKYCNLKQLTTINLQCIVFNCFLLKEILYHASMWHDLVYTNKSFLQSSAVLSWLCRTWLLCQWTDVVPFRCHVSVLQITIKNVQILIRVLNSISFKILYSSKTERLARSVLDELFTFTRFCIF